MDISKEYIQMCEKAIEIQKLWRMKPKHDFFVFKKDYSLPECPSCCYTEHSQQRFDNFIWLPRQDQLQVIWSLGITCFPIAMTNTFARWYQDYFDYTDKFTSLEQVWLAFVMDTKYNKKWNGEIWV